MKKIAMFLLLLAVALTASAQQQRDSVKTNFDSMYGIEKARLKSVPKDVKNVHLWKAGVYERKSATFETLALTTGVLGGVAFSGVLSKKRDVSNMAGGILSFAAVVFLGGHLYYEFSSGAELKLSGNTVALTF